MLYLDLPTRTEFKALADVRTDACVSIYLPTTPLTQESDASRIAFGNLAKEACEQLEAAKIPKSRVAALVEHFDQLAVDGDFWAHQANSLAVLATPDSVKTYRLANTAYSDGRSFRSLSSDPAPSGHYFPSHSLRFGSFRERRAARRDLC